MNNEDAYEKIRLSLGLATETGSTPRNNFYVAMPCQIIYKHNGKAAKKKIYKTHGHAKSALTFMITDAIRRSGMLNISTEMEKEFFEKLINEFDIKDI